METSETPLLYNQLAQGNPPIDPMFNTKFVGQELLPVHPPFITSKAMLGQTMVGCVDKYLFTEKFFAL